MNNLRSKSNLEKIAATYCIFHEENVISKIYKEEGIKKLFLIGLDIGSLE